jgi:gas vesicle protein
MKKVRMMKKRNKRSVGKILTGLVVGSVLGATVGWLTAPASGVEIRRRIMGQAMGPEGAWERAKTAARNVESQARDLAGEVDRDIKSTATQSRRIVTPS